MKQSSRCAWRGSGRCKQGGRCLGSCHEPCPPTALLMGSTVRAGIISQSCWQQPPAGAASGCSAAQLLLLASGEAGHEGGEHVLLLAAAAPRAAAVAHQQHIHALLRGLETRQDAGPKEGLQLGLPAAGSRQQAGGRQGSAARLRWRGRCTAAAGPSTKVHARNQQAIIPL